jgi:hypothetical protein
MQVWEKAECVLAVNYMRRFEPGAASLKKRIESGEFGSIFKGVAWYSKGIMNNGSHFIDLLRFWLGEVTGVDVIRPGRLWNGTDPEPDVCLHFNQPPCISLPARKSIFHGGIDLFAMGVDPLRESGNRGSRWPDENRCCFAAIRSLTPMRRLSRPTSGVTGMSWRRFTVTLSGTKSSFTGTSATETLSVIEEIMRNEKGCRMCDLALWEELKTITRPFSLSLDRSGGVEAARLSWCRVFFPGFSAPGSRLLWR